MEATTLITRSVYDPSNQNNNNASLPQGMSSPPTALSPHLGSTTSPTPAPLTVPTMAYEPADKLNQLDPSTPTVAWPQRYFGSTKDVHIAFEQPSAEQLIQQEMLSQSRNLLMQSMAAREMAASENKYAENGYTGTHSTIFAIRRVGNPCYVRSFVLVCMVVSLTYTSEARPSNWVRSGTFLCLCTIPYIVAILPLFSPREGVTNKPEQTHAARGDWSGYMQQRADT